MPIVEQEPIISPSINAVSAEASIMLDVSNLPLVTIDLLPVIPSPSEESPDLKPKDCLPIIGKGRNILEVRSEVSLPISVSPNVEKGSNRWRKRGSRGRRPRECRCNRLKSISTSSSICPHKTLLS